MGKTKNYLRASNYNKLKTDYKNLQTEYNKLKTNYENLQTENNKLKKEATDEIHQETLTRKKRKINITNDDIKMNIMMNNTIGYYNDINNDDNITNITMNNTISYYNDITNDDTVTNTVMNDTTNDILTNIAMNEFSREDSLEITEQNQSVTELNNIDFITINIEKIKNQKIDVEVQYDPIEKKDIGLQIDEIDFYKNELVVDNDDNTFSKFNEFFKKYYQSKYQYDIDFINRIDTSELNRFQLRNKELPNYVRNTIIDKYLILNFCEKFLNEELKLIQSEKEKIDVKSNIPEAKRYISFRLKKYEDFGSIQSGYDFLYKGGDPNIKYFMKLPGESSLKGYHSKRNYKLKQKNIIIDSNSRIVDGRYGNSGRKKSSIY